MSAQQPLPLVSSCPCMVRVCVRVLLACAPGCACETVKRSEHGSSHARVRVHTKVAVLLSRLSSSVNTRVACLTIVCL